MNASNANAQKSGAIPYNLDVLLIFASRAGLQSKLELWKAALDF
jgi:hypothetical protein